MSAEIVKRTIKNLDSLFSENRRDIIARIYNFSLSFDHDMMDNIIVWEIQKQTVNHMRTHVSLLENSNPPRL